MEWLRARGNGFWVGIGVLATVLILGYLGALTSIAPIDRTLNPDARRYWESKAHFVGRIVDHCSAAGFAADADGNSIDAGNEEHTADKCLDQSFETSGERGYLSPDEVRRLRAELN